jgi:hypothetical protein
MTFSELDFLKFELLFSSRNAMCGTSNWSLVGLFCLLKSRTTEKGKEGRTDGGRKRGGGGGEKEREKEKERERENNNCETVFTLSDFEPSASLGC